MSLKCKGYPLFGAPFNETTDYGFDVHSMVTSFLREEQKPTTHQQHHWTCNQSFCLYRNKHANYNHTSSKVKCTDYVQSNPMDIIHSSSADFICHSTGCNQNILRICEWNDTQLKHGHTFSQTHTIEGISHSHNHFNDETVILSWNRHQAVHLGMKCMQNKHTNYTFETIQEFDAPSNTIFKSAALCPLPFVFNSGMEDSVFFTSCGELMFCKSDGDKHSTIDLQYTKIPPWSELMWSQHPRIIRFACDIEMLTIDLRININQKKAKCAQKHLFFDPITAVQCHKHYISTVGYQGVALYDDRMLHKPLIKYTFYDFDFSLGDCVFSRLQIYPLHNEHNEFWIICSGQNQRTLIYPLFAKPDSPIIGKMPFNMDKYVRCFGEDVRINGVLACNHNDKHQILVTSEYGNMLCTQLELKACERYNEEKYNLWKDAMFERKDNMQEDGLHLMQLQEALCEKRHRKKKKIVYNKWSKQMRNALLNNNRLKYIQSIDESKIRHFAAELEQFALDIMEFTRVPRTIQDIYNEFSEVLHSWKDLTLIDCFKILKAGDIGLNTFQIESIYDIRRIADDEIDENILNVAITYFVSRTLDQTDYLLIEDENESEEEDEEAKELILEDENITKKQKKEEEKDELDLDEFFALSQIAATQEAEANPSVFDAAPIYNDSSGNNQDVFGTLLDNDESVRETLFVTSCDITDKCQNLMDSLCDKWMKGEHDYVISEWSKKNGNNIDYNGMLEKKGCAPKRLHRRIKRVWS